MTTEGTAAASARVRTRSGRALALVLAAGDLGLKALAEHALTGGRSVDLGLLELRLGYNSGAAFNLGADLPAWVVLAVTGALTAAVAVFTWRCASTAGWTVLIGLSAVLAGAVGNLVDRAGDGLVTDYLHTGWWPTFNLADVAICTGAAVIVFDGARQELRERGTQPIGVPQAETSER